jgi:hypothetical protein
VNYVVAVAFSLGAVVVKESINRGKINLLEIFDEPVPQNARSTELYIEFSLRLQF